MHTATKTSTRKMNFATRRQYRKKKKKKKKNKNQKMKKLSYELSLVVYRVYINEPINFLFCFNSGK